MHHVGMALAGVEPTKQGCKTAALATKSGNFQSEL